MKQLIVAILDVWSKKVRTADDDEDDHQKMDSDEQDGVKIAAFLWIRKIMCVGDRSLKEICLKVPLCLSMPSSDGRLPTHPSLKMPA
jgi:hypothetical protein